MHLALLLIDEGQGVSLPVALLLIFGTAKLFAELFQYLRQPAIVGEILAGVILGPAVLAWVKPDEIVLLLAELGVMFLLFRVGLEVRPGDLFRVGGRAIIVAVGGVILPFLAGWLILSAYGEPRIEAVFTGAALVATSVGITARVLSEKGLLDQQSSRIILAAAVFDDILGLVLLAVVSSVAKGSVNILQLATTAALAIGFTVLVALVGSRAVRGVITRAEGRLHAGEVQFNLALIVLFGLAAAAAELGVAAIIGAFLAGMALSETVDQRVHDLAQGVTELLVPFFLVNIGLGLDLRLFADLGLLKISLVILLAAVLSKLVGCGLGALSLGWKPAFQVGVGMIPRGEVGMVVAQLGLSLGVISQRNYAIVVFMAVLTTVIAPPLLNLAFRGVPRGPATPVHSIG